MAEMAKTNRSENEAKAAGFTHPITATANGAYVDALDWVLQRIDEELEGR